VVGHKGLLRNSWELIITQFKDGHGCISSESSFNNWWNDVPDVNIPFPFTITLYQDPTSGDYVFDNEQFFPIDGQGYGNDNNGHNFGFCLELHTQFTYELGQVFSFMGDDDVWVFINQQLVIDIGGVHGATTQSVSLDSLGLTVGNNYNLDFFFCERHVTESHCKITTSIKLNPCGTTDTDGDEIPDLCDPCPYGDQGLKVWTDDTIGPNYGVTFHIALTSVVAGGYGIRVNYDSANAPSSSSDPSGIAGWVDYTVTNGQLDVVYNYDGDGEYTVLVEGDSDAGCGIPGPSTSIVVTVASTRIAPKCSDYAAVPGAAGKRKRSL